MYSLHLENLGNKLVTTIYDDIQRNWLIKLAQHNLRRIIFCSCCSSAMIHSSFSKAPNQGVKMAVKVLF